MLISLLVFYGHSTARAETPEEWLVNLLNTPAEVRREGQLVYFTGFLTTENVERLVNELVDGPTQTLRINSGGGEISASISAAEYIRAKRIDVEVEGLCASACANYIFPAAVSKRILPGAIVAWHGGADQKDFREFRECGRELSSLSGAKRDWTPEAVGASQSDAVREQSFFASLGVSSYITRAGQEPDFYGRNFTFSIEDMEKFGLTRISAERGYGTTEFCKRMSRVRPQLGLLCLPVSSRMLAYEAARIALGETCSPDGSLALRRRTR